MISNKSNLSQTYSQKKLGRRCPNVVLVSIMTLDSGNLWIAVGKALPGHANLMKNEHINFHLKLESEV